MKSNVLPMATRARTTKQTLVDKPISKKKKPTALKIVALGVVIYAGVAVVSFGQQFFQLHGINQNIDRIQQDITSMRQKNQQLSLEIKRLQSDAYIERIAREQLGLVKPGETVLLKAEVNPGKALPKDTVVDVNE